MADAGHQSPARGDESPDGRRWKRKGLARSGCLVEEAVGRNGIRREFGPDSAGRAHEVVEGLVDLEGDLVPAPGAVELNSHGPILRAFCDTLHVTIARRNRSGSSPNYLRTCASREIMVRGWKP